MPFYEIGRFVNVHSNPPPVESSPKSYVDLFKIYFNVFSIVPCYIYGVMM